MKHASGWSWGIALGMAIGLGVMGAPTDAAAMPKNYLDGSIRKLGRGVANIVTAPLELLRGPHFVGEEDGGFAGATVGLGLGVKNMVWRAVGGVIEIVTFPIPIPKDFKPLVKPEFVFANGDWAP